MQSPAMKNPTVFAGILDPRGLIEIFVSPPSSGLTYRVTVIVIVMIMINIMFILITIIALSVLTSRARSRSLSLTKQSLNK